MSHPIRFGTDGWRGAIAEDYTFDNVRRCAQGFADYLLEQGNQDKWVVIGYDKRFLSEAFALAAAEVLAGNNLRVYLTNSATPTPVIAFSVIHKKAAGAANITASHNPPTDNGFKVRDKNGGAIDPDGLIEIERRIPDSIDSVRRMPAGEAENAGRLVFFDPTPPYLENIHKL
ncbi:MAG: phosphoglucomutase/phosphomannomutase family protein, partial [Anaerolineaceae bacterium]|nr:phosphoglucomutase/phosphomannomutase family protein [Anaerolineaceae bacterium]